MKNYLLSAFVIVLLSLQSCELFEKCEETKKPEINFGLLTGGSVLIVESDGDDEFDITADYIDANFKMSYFKIYCDGTS